MTGSEYQALARRTMNTQLGAEELKMHAITGLASEVGEIHSLYQHMIQHGEFDVDQGELFKEIGDAMWFIAELCTCYGRSLDEIMCANIDKLKKRYPEGFDVERSVHRHEVED